MKKKVLVVADVPNWAFDKMYKNIKKFSTNFDIFVQYINKNQKVNHKKYDIIYWLPDNVPNILKQNNIPKEKVIMAIRCKPKHPIILDNHELSKLCSIISVSNKKFQKDFEWFENVHYTPGGIDSAIFTYKKRKTPTIPIIGWAGNSKGWGNDFRGLGIITEAADKLGWKCNFALRHKKWRTEKEMVEYYLNEIDIYVDMSESAGRQNGLIEAMSCGIPSIACNVGASSEIISNGFNGYITQRDSNMLVFHLALLLQHYHIFNINLEAFSNGIWNWENHIKIFENMFKEI